MLGIRELEVYIKKLAFKSEQKTVLEIKMNDVIETELSKAFELLKNREKSSLSSLKEVLRRYEDLRDWASMRGEFETISLQTGRAISNIAFDFMELNDSKRLIKSNKLNFEKNKGVFFLAHRGGLCNRLRAIASLQALSEYFCFPFYFSWCETFACTGGPPTSSLFSNSLSSALNLCIKGNSDFFFEDEPYTPWLFFKKFEECGYQITWKAFSEIYKIKSQELLRNILTKSGAVDIFNEFMAENALEDFIGLHIRRGDFVEYFRQSYPDSYLPSVEAYVDFIKGNSKGKKIFLSTDDSAVKEKFSELLGDDYCHYNFSFDDTKLRQTSFLHSLLDLATLSRSSILIPTPKSSFSDYASSITTGEVIKL